MLLWSLVASAQATPPPDATPAALADADTASEEPAARAEAEQAYLRGIEAFETALYEDAERSFRRATELDPTLARAWTSLGVTLERLDRQAEAERAYHQALEVDFDEFLAALMLADLLAARETDTEALERALELLARVRVLKPERASVLLKQARLLRRLQRRESAEAAYREYTRSVDSVPTAVWFELGVFLEEAKDRPAARLAYEQAAQAASTPEDQESARARIKRIEIEIEADRLGWTVPRRTPPARVLRQVEQARIALAAQDYAQAEAHLRRAIETAPYYAVARILLAACLLVQNQVAEAELELLQAAAADPTNAEVWVQLGDLYLDRFGGKRSGEAVEAYRKALGLRPDLKEVRFRLAEGLRRFGRFEEAIQEYEQYVDEGGEYADEARRLLVELRRKDQELGTPPVPAVLFPDPGAELPPEDVKTAYNQARVLQSLGQLAKARQVLRGLLRDHALGPEWKALVLNLLGTVEQTAGQHAAALTAFGESLALRPGQGDVLEQSANSHLALDRRGEAEAALHRAVELGHTEALFGLARLAEGREAYLDAWRYYGRYLEQAPTGMRAYREIAARRHRELRDQGLAVAAAVLLPLLLLVLILLLRRQRRRSGVPLLTFAEAHPEDLAEVARLLAAIRHEVLKHNATALDRLVAALEQGDPEAAELGTYCAERFFGLDGQGGVAARFERYVADLHGLARARALRLNLAHRDPVFRDLLSALVELRGLRTVLGRIGSLAPAARARLGRRLQGIARRLSGPAVARLSGTLDRLRALPLTPERLAGLHARTAAEPAFAGVDFAPPELEVPAPAPAVLLAPRDLDDLLTNLLRNAARSTVQAGILPVALGLRVRLEEDLITGLRFVVVAVLDASPEQMAPEDLRRGDVSRGLGLAAELVQRADGVLFLDDPPAGWQKAVTVRLPAAEEVSDD